MFFILIFVNLFLNIECATGSIFFKQLKDNSDNWSGIVQRIDVNPELLKYFFFFRPLKNNHFKHAPFELYKNEIECFKDILYPLSEEVYKQSVIAAKSFSLSATKNFFSDTFVNPDVPEQFISDNNFGCLFEQTTVDQLVLHSEYWNKGIVASLEWLYKRNFNNDDVANAYRLAYFFNASFFIQQILINYLYDKDQLKHVIEDFDDELVKEYLLTNNMFNFNKTVPITSLNFASKELRFFNCSKIHFDLFERFGFVDVSSNKIKNIDISFLTQCIKSLIETNFLNNPGKEIIFDFRYNPLSAETKNAIVACESKKVYPNKMIDFYESLNSSQVIKMPEKWRELEILKSQLNSQYFNQRSLYDQKKNQLKIEGSKLADATMEKKVVQELTIEFCKILFFLVLCTFNYVSLTCFLIYSVLSFALYKFFCIEKLKKLDNNYQKITLDLKKNKKELKTNLKKQCNISLEIEKQKRDETIEKLKARQNYKFGYQSALINKQFYILYSE